MLNRLSPISSYETGDVEQRMDLHEILSFVWRQWKFIAAIVAMVMLIGVVWLLRQTPLYTATSQVLLERQREKAPGVEAILTDVALDYAMIESQIAIMRSSVFLRRVVQNEGLVGQPVSDADNSQRAAAGTDSQSIPASEVGVIESLKGALSVSRLVQQGHVLAISVTSPDPIKAARLANAVADAYLLDKLDTRFEAAKRASAWLSDRLVELRKQLRESEEAVAKFRTDNGLFQSGNVTLNQQQLSELNAKLVDARADVAQKKAQVELLDSIQAKGGNLQNVPDISNAGALPTLRQQTATLSQQQSELMARYGATHPLVVNVRAQQSDVERAIVTETRRLVASRKNEYDLAQSRVTSLEQSLREATGQTSIDDTTAIRLRELERTAAVNKSLFEDFLQRAKITQEQSTFEAHEARVISPALPPGAPSSPRKGQYMAINLLIGLFVGVGAAIAKEMLNAGFTTPKQIEDLLGLPVLASVNRMGPDDLRVDGKVVPISHYPAVRPLSRYSEAIRALRSGIQMTDVDHPPKVIQLTSTVPGEGKTTIALSIAGSAASSGLKVLVIDADLRHPSASRVLNVHKERGLVDLLLGQVDVQEVLRLNDEDRYWVLPAGNKTQNPPDLLGSERMKSLVAGFRQTFDMIIIDTPPAGPVIDPVVVSQLSDKIVLIVRWAVTPRELVKQCVQQLSGHRKIAGIAFNHVDENQAQKHGKYAYSYYYGSRYYKKYYTE
jgi:capsular exopolysaccharide synthesis family protein